MCVMHYNRWKRHGGLERLTRPRTSRWAPVAQRFGNNVREGTVPINRRALGPCLIWQGALNGGYGVIRDQGRTRRATHIALELAGVTLAEGQEACHHCDNPPCVRASHLFAGSRRENMLDMVAKGRTQYGSTSPYAGPKRRRSPALGDAIREAWAAGEKNKTALAARLGVSPRTVYTAITGR